MFSFDLESFDLPTFDPIARVRAVAPAAKAKPVNKPAAPAARVPESASAIRPQPVATAAEIELLRSEVSALRAELQALKDAPVAEERRQILGALWRADLVWRNALR